MPVTTRELATDALSTLREKSDQFDLVMIDVNIPEMDCLEFIKSIQLIKNLPIIWMYHAAERHIVEEAVMKGSCFSIQKPISQKRLKNIWQHVYRQRRDMKMVAEKANHDKSRHTVCENDDAGGQAKGDKLTKALKTCIDESTSGGNRELVGSKRKQSFEDGYSPSNERGSTGGENNSLCYKSSESDRKKILHKDGGTSMKKPRIRWTVDLHQKFKEAVDTLGEGACPKEVLEMMDVPDLTLQQVSSHLQKYRRGLEQSSCSSRSVNERIIRFKKVT